MTCAGIEQELVAYHFDALEDEARRAVEAHLVECHSCVRAYVALKRASEIAEDVPRQSDASRMRLRGAVARELGIVTPRRSRWERPLALAVAASVVLVAGAATRALAACPGSAPYALSASMRR